MSDFYCVAPFKMVYIDAKGVSPCCVLPRQSTTLQEWKHNEFLKKIQQETLQGQWPKECLVCRKDEELYGTSLRIQSNSDYDQKHSDTNIDFIDYRSDNQCNFRCRSCNPIFSHLIAKEAGDNPKILSKFYSTDQKKYVTVDKNNYQWIIDNLHQIRRLMFTGGEPTIMPQVKIMLQKALETRHQDLSIMITSNGSFQDKFWYDLTENLPNLHWTLSIDAIGPAAGIIRDGSNWSQIEHNARWLAKNSGSVMINSVISNISLFQLWPLLDFVQDLKHQSNRINGCDHRFHIMGGASHLAAHNLDDQLRTQAIEYLTQCQQQPWESATQNMLQNLKEQVSNSKFDETQWQQSQIYNQELDRLRGQDHTQLFAARYPD